MISLVNNELRLNTNMHTWEYISCLHLVTAWLIRMSQGCCCGLKYNSFLLDNCLHILCYLLATQNISLIA